MSKKKLETLSEAMYYTLLALKKERHGYDIIKSVAEITDGNIMLGAGTVYSLLDRFEREGLIKSTIQDSRRKNYILTQQGVLILQKEYHRLQLQLLAWDKF